MIYNVWFTTNTTIPLPQSKKMYSYKSDNEYNFGQFVMVDTSHGPALCIVAGRADEEDLMVPKNRLKQIYGRVLIEQYLENRVSRAKRRPPVWWDEMTGGKGLTWWKENS